MNLPTAKSEILLSIKEANFLLNNLDSLAAPEPKRVPLLQFPGTGMIYKNPLGVVLIISPWNYPLSLVFMPLAGALAAGNTVLVKPSEVCENVSQTISELFPKYFDSTCVRLVHGAVAETTEVLKYKFDHIFYTGNGAVARVIMRAAAEYLTPVTLELGGKSPCIIDRDVNLKHAAPRICFGKYNNAGQTCVAPDYVLIHKDIQDQFINEMISCIKEFYGENPRTHNDFGKIINSRHATRLSGLLKEQENNIVHGGKMDVDGAYIEPTIVKNPSLSSKLMTEEIFGPILPVVAIESIDEAISFINGRAKPLALYIFANDQKNINKVLTLTTSGGACVNETTFHVLCPELPFGGVGSSGMGCYHGNETFNTFVHRKGVLNKPLGGDPAIRYPPFTQSKVKWLERLNSINLNSPNSFDLLKVLALVVGLFVIILYLKQ